MPKQLSVDWELAKLLYAKLVPVPDIAKKLGVKVGTLRKRIDRHGWATRRQVAQEMVAQQAQSQVVESLPALADKLRRQLARDAAQVAALVCSRDSNELGLSELEARERIITSVQKRGFTALGMDSVPQQMVVNIAVIDALGVDYENREKEAIESVCN